MQEESLKYHTADEVIEIAQTYGNHGRILEYILLMQLASGIRARDEMIKELEKTVEDLKHVRECRDLWKGQAESLYNTYEKKRHADG